MDNLIERMRSADFTLCNKHTDEAVTCFKRLGFLNKPSCYVLYIEEVKAEDIVKQIEHFRNRFAVEFKDSVPFYKLFCFITVYVFIEKAPNVSSPQLKKEMYSGLSDVPANSFVYWIKSYFQPIQRVLVTYIACGTGSGIEEVKIGLVRPNLVNKILESFRA